MSHIFVTNVPVFLSKTDDYYFWRKYQLPLGVSICYDPLIKKLSHRDGSVEGHSMLFVEKIEQ